MRRWINLGRRRGYPGAGLDTALEDVARGAAAAVPSPTRQWLDGRLMPAWRLRRVRSNDDSHAALDAALPSFVAVPHPDVTSAENDASNQQQGVKDGVCETVATFVARTASQLHARCADRPYDVSAWLAFAAHQADVASQGLVPRKEVPALHAKQVAILERALSHHPGSESVLLALLDAAQAAGDAPTLMDARWESALRSAPGAPRLWRTFLSRVATRSGPGDALTAACRRAVAALAMERDRRAASLRAMPVDSPGYDEVASSVSFVDDALIDVVMTTIEADLEAGHEARGVRRLQAVVEFACFCTSTTGATGGGSHTARLRAFSRFLASGAPMWGNAGASGWGAWCDAQHANGIVCAAPPPPPPPPPLPPPTAMPTSAAAAAADAFLDSLDGEQQRPTSDEGPDEEVAPDGDNEDDDALLARLGITLDPDVLTASCSADVLSAWLSTEDGRDEQRWCTNDDDSVDHSAVLDILFTPCSEAARQRLCDAALTLIGAAGLRHTSTQHSALTTWPLTALPHRGTRARWIAGEAGRRDFTRAALMLTAARFPRHWTCARSALRAQPDIQSARTAAKSLLALHPGSLPLWTALAETEASAGKFTAARKVFLGALSLAATSQQHQQHGALLAAVSAAAADAAAAAKVVSQQHGDAERSAVDSTAPHAADIPGLVRAYAAFESSQSNSAVAVAALAALGAGTLAAWLAQQPPGGIASAADLSAAAAGYQSALSTIASQPMCLRAPGGINVATCASGFLHKTASSGAGAACRALLQCAQAVSPPHHQADGGGGGADAGVAALYVEALNLMVSHPGCIPPSLVARTATTALALFPGVPDVCASVLAASRAARVRDLTVSRCFDAAIVAGGGEAPLAAALCAAGLDSCRGIAVLSRATTTGGFGSAIAQLPITWRLRIASDVLSGDAARLRRAFFRAAAQVPCSKAVWLDGLAACNSVSSLLSDAERAQLLEAAQRDRCLKVHTDLYEIALERQLQGHSSL